MLALIIAAARQALPYGTPAVTGLTITTEDAGRCGELEEASYRIAWTVANADKGAYYVNLYEDGVFLSRHEMDDRDTRRRVPGVVENGPVDPFLMTRTYRVDLVRRLDGAVVSSETATWEKIYGGCDGGSSGGGPGGGGGEEPSPEPE